MIQRIVEIRKKNGLNQEQFAQKIGMSRSFINQVEVGKRNLSDRTISDICREFGVNEAWLRTGEGEMFLPSPDGALEALAREYELSPGMYVLIKRLLALRPENQQAAVDFAVKIAEDLNEITAGWTVADAGGQERTKLDRIAAALKDPQNQKDAAPEIAPDVPQLDDNGLTPEDAEELERIRQEMIAKRGHTGQPSALPNANAS